MVMLIWGKQLWMNLNLDDVYSGSAPIQQCSEQPVGVGMNFLSCKIQMLMLL